MNIYLLKTITVKILSITILLNGYIITSSSSFDTNLKAIESLIAKHASISDIMKIAKDISNALDKTQENNLKNNILLKYSNFSKILGDGYSKFFIDSKDNKEIKEKSSIHAVALSSNGSLALTACANRTNTIVNSWNINDEITKGRTFEKQMPVTAVALSPDPNNLQVITGSGDADGTLSIWSFNRKNATTTILEAPINAIAISSNGCILVAFSNYAKRFQQSGFNLEEIGTITSTGIVNCVAFSPKGDYCASGDNKGIINIQHSKSEPNFKILDNNSVESLAINPGLKLVLAGFSNNRAKLYDLGTNQSLRHEFINFHEPVKAVDFCKEYTNLAIMASGGCLKVYDISNLKNITEVFSGDIHSSAITSIGTTGNIILTGSDDRRALLLKIVSNLYALSIVELAFLIKISTLTFSPSSSESKIIEAIIKTLGSRDSNLADRIEKYISSLEEDLR